MFFIVLASTICWTNSHLAVNAMTPMWGNYDVALIHSTIYNFKFSKTYSSNIFRFSHANYFSQMLKFDLWYEHESMYKFIPKFYLNQKLFWRYKRSQVGVNTLPYHWCMKSQSHESLFLYPFCVGKLLFRWFVKMSSILPFALIYWKILMKHFYTPRLNEVESGVYWFHLVHHSVCPSVDRIVSALYLQQYSSDPFHICTSYQATSEGV